MLTFQISKSRSTQAAVIAFCVDVAEKGLEKGTDGQVPAVMQERRIRKLAGLPCSRATAA